MAQSLEAICIKTLVTNTPADRLLELIDPSNHQYIPDALKPKLAIALLNESKINSITVFLKIPMEDYRQVVGKRGSLI